MEQLGLGNETLGLLQAIQQLQTQPLVPSDNPLLALGTILSGFSAGSRGQVNPILQQLQTQRQGDISTGLSAAGLRLNVDTARSSARHQEFQESEAKLTREAREKDLALSTARFMLDQAGQIRSPELAVAGYTKLADSGLVPDAFKDPAYIKKAAEGAINRADFLKQETLLAAKALSGMTDDPELVKLAPNFVELAKTPKGQAALKMAYKLTDPGLYLLEEQHKRLKAQVDMVKAEADLEVSNSIKGGLAPSGTALTLAMQDKTPEQLATLATLMQKSGSKIPPALASFMAQYQSRVDLALKSGQVELEIKKLIKDLDTEKLDILRKTKDVDIAGAYLDKVKTLSAVLFNSEFLSADVKKRLEKPLMDIVREMETALVKRAGAPPVVPPPAAGEGKAGLMEEFGLGNPARPR